MASGSFETVFAHITEYTTGEVLFDYKLKVDWTSTPNVAANTSTLTMKFWVYVPLDRTTSPITATQVYNRTLTINLGGSTYSMTTRPGSIGWGQPAEESWVPLSTKSYDTSETVYTTTIAHNTDGTKSLDFSLLWNTAPNGNATVSYKGDYWESSGMLSGKTLQQDVALSGTMVLDAIDRSPKILTASNFTDEENPVITYSNPAGDGATLLQACISFTGGNDDIAYRDISKTGSSYTFELTEDERNVLRVAAINAQSIPVRFYVKGIVGGKTYWDYVTRTFTVTNCNPVISNPIVRDVNSDTLALTGDENTLIRYVSMAEYSYEVTTSKQATIANQFVQCGNKKVTGLSQGVIDDPESGLFVFSVTDSRGLTTTATVEKTLIEYVKPTCYQSFDIDLTGETGATITLTISGNFYTGSFGDITNTLKIEVRHTQNDGSMGDWVDLSPLLYTTNNNTYELKTTITGLSYSQAYTFQSRVTDKLFTVHSSEYTTKVLPVFDWGESDFNFNVPVKINGETVLRHNVDANNIVLSASGGHIYLRPGGTNDTSSEAILYPDGSVSFSGPVTANGEVLGGAADYVVETGTEAMGTNGTWYWTKWASGKAECYGMRNFGSMAITTAWGSLYRSAALNQNLPSGLFAAAPEVILINLINSNYGGWVAKHETSAPSSTNTGSFIVCRPASATIAPTHMSFSIIGRWQ